MGFVFITLGAQGNGVPGNFASVVDQQKRDTDMLTTISVLVGNSECTELYSAG